MFTTGQSIRAGVRNQVKNGLWKPGTRFVNREPVNRHFSYKELTVILGILVALIVVITLWIGQPAEQHPVESIITLPHTPFPDAETVKKTMTEVLQ